MEKSYLINANVNYKNYFCVESLEDGNEISFTHAATSTTPGGGGSSFTSGMETLEFSTNYREWALWGNTSRIVTLNKGQKLYLRNNPTVWQDSTNIYVLFQAMNNGSLIYDGWYLTSTKKVNIKGDLAISNLCYGMVSCYTIVTWAGGYPHLLTTGQLQDYAEYSLFKGLKVVNALDLTIDLSYLKRLPTDTKASVNLSGLFRNQIYLKTAPRFICSDIANTSVNEISFYKAFEGCTNLEVLPNINQIFTTPVVFNESTGDRTTWVYRDLFNRCSNIKVSTTNVDEYTYPINIPAYTSPVPTFLDAFANTGGTFTGTPSVNTTYYSSNVSRI